MATADIKERTVKGKRTYAVRMRWTDTDGKARERTHSSHTVKRKAQKCLRDAAAMAVVAESSARMRRDDVDRSPLLGDILKQYRDSKPEGRRVEAEWAIPYLMPVFGQRSLASLRVVEIKQYLWDIPGRRGFGGDPLTAASAYNVRKVARAAVNVAIEREQFQGVNAFALAKPPPRQKPITHVFTEAELDRIIPHLGQWGPLFGIMGYNGLRVGEAASILLADVDFDARLVTVQRSWLGDHTKTHRARTIPMMPKAEAYFRAWFEVDRTKWRKTEWENRRKVLGMAMRRARVKAGIDRPVSPKGVRHTFATLLAHKGVSSQVVAGMMGHTNSRITETIYQHLGVRFLQQGVEGIFENEGGDND